MKPGTRRISLAAVGETGLLALATLFCAIPLSAARGASFAPPDSVVQEIISSDDFDWSVVRTAHFEIYYETDTYASQRLDFLKDLAEEALARSLRILQEARYSRGMRIFLIDTRDRMIPLTGSRAKGFTLIGHGAVLLVYNENVRPYMRHEVFHAVSIVLWGMPEPWLREGSAVYADGMCFYEDPLRTIPAYLVTGGHYTPITRLINDFTAVAAKNDVAAYLEAGGLVQYLFDEYGTQRIRQLWQQGSSAIELIFGKTIEALESEWLEQLEEIDPRVVDWEMLADKGCG